MIIYPTSRTLEHYEIKLYNELSSSALPQAKMIFERDSGDALREWGLSLFDFLGRNCLVVMNYASKFALFLFDVKVNDMQSFGNIIAYYMLELYAGDKEMTNSLLRMFEQDHMLIFAPIRNRTLTVQLNAKIKELHSKRRLFCEYIDCNRKLHTRHINYEINFAQPGKYNINGEEAFLKPGLYFRKRIVERYGGE